MQLEYLNGIRVHKHYYEMTPLEAAIENYETQAKKHHTSEDTSNLTKTEREKKLKESLDFLGKERMKLEKTIEVQSLLEAYRAEGNKAITGTKQEAKKAVARMTSEDHHPTELLEKLMRAEGTPKPSRHHTAHHILPGSGQYRQALISTARVHMHLNGIRINDPANGVYLVTVDKNTPHWSMPKSRGHLKYHTAAYEEWTSRKVVALKGIDRIKTQLQIIGRLLQQNEPKAAINKIQSLR